MQPRATVSYHRAYKACITCRKRKGRCEIGEDWVPGAPCKRCQRQMQECVFPIDRIGPKKTGPSTPSATGADKPEAPPSTESNQPSVRFDLQESPQFTPGRPDRETCDYTDSVMRTMVSSGNDALEVLFDPVRHGAEHSTAVPEQDTRGSQFMAPNPPLLQPQPYRVRGPGSSSSIHDVWNACRFIKQGWFSAEEGIFYVDMFFENLQKLSPIMSDFYGKHENHYRLISSEPFLCCTILAISARYHNLPTISGAMRSYYIHERMWTHIQHLLLRIILGQEKNSKGKTRSPGTIEALLLLTEWYPRCLAFPPQFDGWDSDLLVHWTNEQDNAPVDRINTARGHWLEDVINPAKRTGHMSWMFVSCAVSLACELGIFEDSDFTTNSKPNGTPIYDQSQPNRHIHLQRLLYLYAEQISLQRGYRSMLPQGISQQLLRRLPESSNENADLQAFMVAWIDLTKLTRLVMETLYPSAQQTLQLLQSGRYVTLLEQFRPMLFSWAERFLDNHSYEFEYFRHILEIEYNSTRLYCLSLCIQSIIERRTNRSGNISACGLTLHDTYDFNDHQSIEDVVASSSRVLEISVHLSNSRYLQNAPARITLRIIAASIFLLKGLGIGVAANKLEVSLKLLRSTTKALRESAVDEMQLGLRYASLLEMHISRLQNSFVASTFPPMFSNNNSMPGSTLIGDASGSAPNFSEEMDTISADDWFSLPFDATFAPADFNELPCFSSFDDNDLDFIWNLGIFEQ